MMQICGVTCPEDAQLAVDQGADFVGEFGKTAMQTCRPMFTLECVCLYYRNDHLAQG